MPQLAMAAKYHGRSARFRRCAYQANVMKTLERTSRPAVRNITEVPMGPSCSVWNWRSVSFGIRSGRRSTDARQRDVSPSPSVGGVRLYAPRGVAHARHKVLTLPAARTVGCTRDGGSAD